MSALRLRYQHLYIEPAELTLRVTEHLAGLGVRVSDAPLIVHQHQRGLQAVNQDLGKVLRGGA